MSSTDFNPLTLSINLDIWFASYAVVVFDYICTFGTEVTHAWPCPLTVGLVLFYLNRYLPFFDIVIYVRAVLYPLSSSKDCLWVFPLAIWMATTGLLISEAIMLMRTYAIWGRRRLIFWVLAGLVAVVFGPMVGLLAWKTWLDLQYDSSKPSKPVGHAFQCWMQEASFNNLSSFCLLLFFMLIFVSESVIMALTVIKAKQHLDKGSARWLFQFYQNGLIYCACMLVLSLSNAIMALVAPPAYKTSFFPMQRALHSVFCNRVFFLILKNRSLRNSRHLGHSGNDNTGTTMIFTSVHPETNDDIELSITSWQERAETEWIR
ncbi:hypothetical protein CPB84DRAFT_264000 [Gymnopilus junonius]|uniref:DUF6533 domain-containing protein n=1 Tax=Gymnopilus junonius TaxID=109634 RepID=A0A9P5TQJ1_GYMJU|nr:hypothetical protein CPB84DRAFT_264000 [Gymnopilus junonius]